MSKNIIVLQLSEVSIDNTIKELEQYKKSIIKKTELLREKIAELIKDMAQTGFNEIKNANVNVTVDNKKNTTTIIAIGENAVWIEFGTGVYYNGAAGSSPHPKGIELGFTIGDYGKGMGKKTTWGYYEDGKLSLTHGMPARMPLYRAMEQNCNKISAIAKEVFI